MSSVNAKMSKEKVSYKAHLRNTTLEQSSKGRPDRTTAQWFSHSSADRIDTKTVIVTQLKQQYPQLNITVTSPYTNLIAYAAAGHAQFSLVTDPASHLPSSIDDTEYVAPQRRLDPSPGYLLIRQSFAKYLYNWQGHEFIVYVVSGAEAGDAFALSQFFYILSADQQQADALLLAVGQWSNELHGEVLVYDEGYWQKNAQLYDSVMKASWDAVILDPKMKKAIIDDHLSFYESRDTYEKLKVSWKRGIIYHGPPGNGKTISIKATMKMLYQLKEQVPTLYVRSLSSWMGPEGALSDIFTKARQFAPCYLVFEDLDSIIGDEVRSYFLNEVDGIKNNDGIFMIGSTNHLERLDPGISKRPSRFDRKYYFPNPSFRERVQYCKFWQSKLADNEDLDFPDKLCDAIAGITDKFSFAYIQEAFVASLLALARQQRGPEEDKDDASMSVGGVQVDELCDDWVGLSLEKGDDEEDDDLKDLALWKEIKKQIKILREAIEDGGSDDDDDNDDDKTYDGIPGK